MSCKSYKIVSVYQVTNLLLTYQLKNELTDLQIVNSFPNPLINYVVLYSVSEIYFEMFRTVIS